MVVRDRHAGLLKHRWTPVLLAFIGVALALPALWAGILGDDYFHRLVLLDIGEWGAQTDPVRDLFAFVPETMQPRMMELGYLPWWSDPAIHISFARPVTALTHILDYRMWSDCFVLQHLHSLLWFGLGIVLVALLYRRLHTSAVVAGVAGLLFAVEDAHAMPAGWLANRNALLCLVFGTLTILLHVEWRRGREFRHLAAGLCVLAIGLGSGEATVGALGYVAAWQLTQEDGSLKRRLLPLAPYVGLMLAWRVLYDKLGYGAVGSSLYVDPVRQPQAFVGAVVERGPLLMAAQWLQMPVDIWLALPRSAQVVFSLVSAGLAVLVVVLLWDLLQNRSLARFWVLGMTLSLVPLCAAFPMDRLLLFPGIGAFGVLAMLLRARSVWFWGPTDAVGWKRRIATALLVLHGPVAAMLLAGRTAALPMFGEFFSAGARTSPSEPGVENQTFIYVNGNDFTVVYTHIIREVDGFAPAPRRLVRLASMADANEVLREDDTTLVITPKGGFLSRALDRLLANPERPVAAHEKIELPDYVAEIRATTRDGRPAKVAFRFRRPLEDPSLRFLYWRDGELLEFPLPRVGESVILEANFPL